MGVGSEAASAATKRLRSATLTRQKRPLSAPKRARPAAPCTQKRPPSPWRARSGPASRWRTDSAHCQGDRPRGRPRKSAAADATAALPAADLPCAAPWRGQRRELWASGTFAASVHDAKRAASDRALAQNWKWGIWARGTLTIPSSAATGKAVAASSQAAVTLPAKVDLCGIDASKGGDQRQKDGTSEALSGECSAILPPKGGGWQWLLQFRAHHAKANAKKCARPAKRIAAGAGRPLRPAAAVVCVASAAGHLWS